MAFVLYFFSIEVPVSSYLNKVISKTGKKLTEKVECSTDYKTEHGKK